MGLFNFLKSKFSGKKQKNDAQKYVVGMQKSRSSFGDRLKSLAGRYKNINDAYFDELAEILIEADVGTKLTFSIIEATREDAQKEKLSDPQTINELVVDKMFISYVQTGESIVNEIEFTPNETKVLMMVGVNGVGKTTTIAKLAHRYQAQGKRVMLAAADTFRAGAIEQLKVWADRLHLPIITGKDGVDPASVVYDAVIAAQKEKIDLLIVDTAGRLQTKVNLMAELSKMRRVISKELPGEPSEVFLVIDATTGQNGVIQAKAFAEATGITGIVITKMDGTAKGGIILAIRDELGIPVRFIGLGEGMDDLTEFDLDQYLYGLCLGDDIQ